MIEDAKSVHPVPHSVFDKDSYLFNCQNGTLDLRTMVFRRHDPRDFLTLLAGVKYDMKANCPRWNQFITEVMKGNTETALYLQKGLHMVTVH